MRRSVLLACVSVASLAPAGPALASFAPKLVVSSAAAPTASALGAPTQFGIVAGAADDPAATVSIYIPDGFQVATPAAGTSLGSATGTAAAADLDGAVVPLSGSLVSIDPIALTASQQARADTCLQGATASQTWELNFTVADQPLGIPVFVLPVSTSEATSGYQTKLVLCLQPPDTPPTDANRAIFGAKLLSATFTASAITPPATGSDFLWTSLWQPFDPGLGSIDATGSVEAQAFQPLPAALTLVVKRTKVTAFVKRKVKGKLRSVRVVRTRVTFSTTVTDGSAAPASAAITTTANGKPVGGASGSFTLARGTSAVVKAVAVLDSDSGSIATGLAAVRPVADLFFHDLGPTGCTASTIAGGFPCAGATVGGKRLAATTRIKGYS